MRARDPSMMLFMPEAQTLFTVVQIVVLGSPAIIRRLDSRSAGYKLVPLHRTVNPGKSLRRATFL
jgi:hypothetical protein